MYQVFGSKKWIVDQEIYLLEPGQALFIPKGHKHKVLAENSPSLHISISTYEETLRDHLLNRWDSPVMEKGLHEVSEDDIKSLFPKSK